MAQLSLNKSSVAIGSYNKFHPQNDDPNFLEALIMCSLAVSNNKTGQLPSTFF
jgi:hypothetical protein